MSEFFITTANFVEKRQVVLDRFLKYGPLSSAMTSGVHVPLVRQDDHALKSDGSFLYPHILLADVGDTGAPPPISAVYPHSPFSSELTPRAEKQYDRDCTAFDAAVSKRSSDTVAMVSDLVNVLSEESKHTLRAHKDNAFQQAIDQQDASAMWLLIEETHLHGSGITRQRQLGDFTRLDQSAFADHDHYVIDLQRLPFFYRKIEC